MIKLKSLLFESKNIIVGIITTDGQILSTKDATEHSDVLRKHGHHSFARIEHRWRYNTSTKTVYWWDMWTKSEGEMVMDHLKHKYKAEVLHHVLIPDDSNFQKFYNLAHGLTENNTRINTFKKELADFIKRWRKAPEGSYEKTHLMDLIKIAKDEIEKEKKKSSSQRDYEQNRSDFLKHHYTGFIGSDAYKEYEKEGGLAWLGDKSKYPVLLDKGKYGNFEVEFRQTGERNRYVKHDAEGEIVRYSNGEVGYMSPDEIKQQNLPEYNTSIVAFIGDKPVGFAADEFGAVGVWVEGPYQRLGIGTDLLDKHIEQRPSVKSGRGKIGQMTNKGIGMTQKYYDLMAKRHGPDWFKKLRQKNG